MFSLDKPEAPSKPEIIDVTKSTATLKWLPPSFDGGSPIINYIVEMKPSSTYKWLPASQNILVPDTSFLVKDLVDGAEYEFRVFAENKAGPSGPSPPSQTIAARDPICA